MVLSQNADRLIRECILTMTPAQRILAGKGDLETLRPPSPLPAHHDTITGPALLPGPLHPHLASVFTSWVLTLFPTDCPVLCEILIQVSPMPSPKHQQATRPQRGHQKASLQCDILTAPLSYDSEHSMSPLLAPSPFPALKAHGFPPFFFLFSSSLNLYPLLKIKSISMGILINLVIVCILNFEAKCSTRTDDS